MSLLLEFEPHSWFMDFAIKDNRWETRATYKKHFATWEAFTESGNTYRADHLEADTLADLKQKIAAYHLAHRDGYGERIAKRRLEYLRGEIEAERISYGEIAELQGLAAFIEDDDITLLQWAGVPEGSR